MRKTRRIKLAGLAIGAGAPVSVQSMTNTDTRDIISTVRQIKSLEKAGCEVIRLAVKNSDSAEAIAGIKSKVSLPVEADIHFDYRLALSAIASGADGIRLNPGNIYKPSQLKAVIKACRDNKIPVRIGVNSGSLPGIDVRRTVADRMVKAALRYIKIFERQGFYNIMVSLKASDAADTISAYRKMALLCDYPFHIGATATGEGQEAVIKSAIVIGTLLSEGIGDTIRVSLTGKPEDEVVVAKEILQGLGMRSFGHDVISCPTCGRCQVDLIRIVKDFKKRLTAYNLMLNTKRFCSIAIMGCEVNGPGEAREADIGIAFGRDSGILFKKGRIIKKVKAKDAVKELLALLRIKR